MLVGSRLSLFCWRIRASYTIYFVCCPDRVEIWLLTCNGVSIQYSTIQFFIEIQSIHQTGIASGYLTSNLRIQSLRLTPERKLDYFLQKYNFVMTK